VSRLWRWVRVWSGPPLLLVRDGRTERRGTLLGGGQVPRVPVPGLLAPPGGSFVVLGPRRRGRDHLILIEEVPDVSAGTPDDHHAEVRERRHLVRLLPHFPAHPLQEVRLRMLGSGRGGFAGVKSYDRLHASSVPGTPQLLLQLRIDVRRHPVADYPMLFRSCSRAAGPCTRPWPNF
jgi:hypothetical protein